MTAAMTNVRMTMIKMTWINKRLPRLSVTGYEETRSTFIYDIYIRLAGAKSRLKIITFMLHFLA